MRAEDLDLVYTATPWEWHTPVCLAAMRNGKHAATEIPAAITLDECWQLVETSEKTGKYCVMMENVNYMREEMAILKMVREGSWASLSTRKAAYEHDTRYLKIRDYGDGLWLGAHHREAEWQSLSAPWPGTARVVPEPQPRGSPRLPGVHELQPRGMDLYAKEHLPPDHPKRVQKYINGDVNSSLIRTANGMTIILKHDTDLPRPYSRTHLVQGTRGSSGASPNSRFASRVRTRPQQSLGARLGLPGRVRAPPLEAGPGACRPGVGHRRRESGPVTGDFLEDSRLIEALQAGVPPDFDVYDAATWSVVAPLSEKSVADRSRPVDFPDFTRGKWKTTRPSGILGV